MPFQLTEEQKQTLRKGKLVLQKDEAIEIRADEAAGCAEARKLLELTKFAQGCDLTAEQVDELFKCARRIAQNRQLSRLLYEGVGLPAFNSKLRTLLFGTGSLQQRIAGCCDVKFMGYAVVSQLLCLLDPKEYPFYSWKTYDEVLALSPEQKADARKEVRDALGDFEDSEDLTWAAELLERMLVLKRVREFLGVKDFLDVNLILWFARDEEGGGGDDSEESEVHTTSVSLERDLRDHIARNPGKLEKGLEVYDRDRPTEYPTDNGRIDVLLKDPSTKALVVVETKKGRSSDQVVGQTMRYMGSLLRSGSAKKVRGIIVLHEEDPDLTAAMAVAPPNIELRYYAVQFTIDRKPIVT